MQLLIETELLLTIARKNIRISSYQINFMSFTKESAVERAKSDLAKRLNVKENDIKVGSVNDKDFPDMSLGAAAKGEMSGQMISSGWQIELGAGGKNYEYRADKYQLRLKGFEGKNHVIVS
jgi:hypothetical protein